MKSSHQDCLSIGESGEVCKTISPRHGIKTSLVAARRAISNNAGGFEVELIHTEANAFVDQGNSDINIGWGFQLAKITGNLWLPQFCVGDKCYTLHTAISLSAGFEAKLEYVNEPNQSDEMQKLNSINQNRDLLLNKDLHQLGVSWGPLSGKFKLIITDNNQVTEVPVSSEHSNRMMTYYQHHPFYSFEINKLAKNSIATAQQVMNQLGKGSHAIQALHEKSYRRIIDMMNSDHRSQLKQFAKKIALELRSKLPEDDELKQSDIQKHWLNHKVTILQNHFKKLNIKENSAEGSLLTYMVSEAYFYPDSKSPKNRGISDNDYTNVKSSIKELRVSAKQETENYSQNKSVLFEQEQELTKQFESKLRAHILPNSLTKWFNKKADLSNAIGLMAGLTGNSKLSHKMFSGAQALALVPTALNSGIEVIETLASAFSAGTSFGLGTLGTLSSAFAATAPILMLFNLIPAIFGDDDEDEEFLAQLMGWLSVRFDYLDKKLDVIINGIGILEEYAIENRVMQNQIISNQYKLADMLAEGFTTVYKKLDESHYLLAQTSRQITSENAATQAMILEWWGSQVQSYSEKLQRALRKGGKTLELFLEHHFDSAFVDAKQVVQSKALTAADKDLSIQHIQALLANLRDPRQFLTGNYLDVFNVVNLLQNYAIKATDEKGVALLPDHLYQQLSHPDGLRILAQSLLAIAKQLQSEGKDVRKFLPSIEDDMAWLESEASKANDFFNKLSSEKLKEQHNRAKQALLSFQSAVKEEINIYEQEQKKLALLKDEPQFQREKSLLENEQHWGRSHYSRPLVWRRPPWRLGLDAFEQYHDSSWDKPYDGKSSPIQAVGFVDSAPTVLQEYHKFCQNNVVFRTTDCNSDHVNAYRVFFSNVRNSDWRGPPTYLVSHFHPQSKSFSDVVIKFDNVTLSQELRDLSRIDFMQEQKDYFDQLHQNLINWYKKTNDSPTKLKLITPKSGKGIVLRLPKWLDYEKLFAKELQAEALGIGYLEFVYTLDVNTKFTIDINFVYNHKRDEPINLYQFHDYLNRHILKHTNPESHPDEVSVYSDMDMISYYWNGGYYFHVSSAKKMFYLTEGFFQTLSYAPHQWQVGRWDVTAQPHGSVFEISLNHSNHQIDLQKHIDECKSRQNLESLSRIKNNILQSKQLGQSIDQFELYFRVSHHLYLIRAMTDHAANELHNQFLKIANTCNRDAVVAFIDKAIKAPTENNLSSHIQQCVNELNQLTSFSVGNNKVIQTVFDNLDELHHRLTAPVSTMNPQIDFFTDNQISVSHAPETQQPIISPIENSIAIINNTIRVDWDKTIKKNSITGQPIYTFRAYGDNQEVGSAVFYGHDYFCYSQDGTQHNLLDTQGIFKVNLTKEMALGTCTFLPPSMTEKMIYSAKYGAAHGFLRGAANVMSETLKSKGVKKSTAKQAAQAMYYGSFFAAKVASQSSRVIDLDSCLQVIYESATETFQILAINTALTCVNKLLASASRIATNSKWTNTATVLNIFGAIPRYGIFVNSAVNEGIAPMASAVVAGTGVQIAVETLGKP